MTVVDEVAIVDFGEVYEPSHLPKRLGIPRAFAAPEVTLGRLSDVGFHSDIWSLACTLLEVRLDSRPDGDRASVLRWVERLVGPVPHPYRATAKKMWLESQGKAYDEIPHTAEDATGALEPITGPINKPMNYREEREANESRYTSPLEMKIAAPSFTLVTEPDPLDPTAVYTRKAQVFYSMADEEVPVFADLLRQMLKYEPGSRASAEEVLQHPWFIGSRLAGAVVPASAKYILTALRVALAGIALLVCILVVLSSSGLNRSEVSCYRAPVVIHVYDKTDAPPLHSAD